MKTENSRTSTRLDRLVGLCMVFVICCLSGCESPPIEVKIISVKTQEQYESQNGWNAEFAHAVLEDVKTRERFKKRGDTWGKVGDVFFVVR